MILALLPWPPEKPELLADISFLLALNKNWFQISTSFPHHRGASQHCSSRCSSVAHAMSHLTSDRSLPKPPPSAAFSHEEPLAPSVTLLHFATVSPVQGFLFRFPPCLPKTAVLKSRQFIFCLSVLGPGFSWARRRPSVRICWLAE